jgi:hypothetical protein
MQVVLGKKPRGALLEQPMSSGVAVSGEWLVRSACREAACAQAHP